MMMMRRRMAMMKKANTVAARSPVSGLCPNRDQSRDRDQSAEVIIHLLSVIIYPKKWHFIPKK